MEKTKITDIFIRECFNDKNWERSIKNRGYKRKESLFSNHYEKINEVFNVFFAELKTDKENHEMVIRGLSRAIFSYLLNSDRKKIWKVILKDDSKVYMDFVYKKEEILEICEEQYGKDSVLKILESTTFYSLEDIKEMLSVYLEYPEFLLAYITYCKNEIAINSNGNYSENISDKVKENEIKSFLYDNVTKRVKPDIFNKLFIKNFGLSEYNKHKMYVSDYPGYYTFWTKCLIDNDPLVANYCLARKLGLTVKGYNAVEPLRSIYLENNKSKKQKDIKVEVNKEDKDSEMTVRIDAEKSFKPGDVAFIEVENKDTDNEEVSYIIGKMVCSKYDIRLIEGFVSGEITSTSLLSEFNFYCVQKPEEKFSMIYKLDLGKECGKCNTVAGVVELLNKLYSGYDFEERV